MSWFGSEIEGPLVLTRAIHFAASAAIAGVLMFRGFVAEPALRPSPEGYSIVRSRLAGLAWMALAIAVVTGLIWLVLQTMLIADLGWGEAVKSGAIWTVVNETQFGLVIEIRAVWAILLAACLLLSQLVLSRWLALLAASVLVAAIAWTGMPDRRWGNWEICTSPPTFCISGLRRPGSEVWPALPFCLRLVGAARPSNGDHCSRTLSSGFQSSA